MKKTNVLRDQRDFARVFRSGKKISGRLITVMVLSNGLLYPRFAYVTPRKNERSAVKRNLLRRRAREWVRKNYGLFRKPEDFVFFFKSQAFSSKKSEFYEELDSLVGKIRK